ncbi:MAG: FHA domain-containing protein [Spirochaetales bacterium]|nr:FHA domain-containing protein [Spirochaetales bacterium]
MVEQGDIAIPNNVTLEVVKGEDEGQVFAITNKTMTIGRAPVCDIKLTDKYASNKHCQIVFRGGHFTVIDLGSLNKTKVNGNMYVQKNLINGDIVRVGKTELKFNWEAMDESSISDADDIMIPDDDSALKSEE